MYLMGLIRQTIAKTRLLMIGLNKKAFFCEDSFLLRI